MKYYLPTFDEIDSLRKDYVDVFLAAQSKLHVLSRRRFNGFFLRAAGL